MMIDHDDVSFNLGSSKKLVVLTSLPLACGKKRSFPCEWRVCQKFRICEIYLRTGLPLGSDGVHVCRHVGLSTYAR
jgi:hypothetical protein